MKLGASSVEGIPIVAQLVSPDRWLLWLGILFVLSVYHFPSGVVGRLRAMRTLARRAERRAAPKPARVPSGDRPTYPSDEGSS
jgi:branched-chain amino acid transport system permease protein